MNWYKILKISQIRGEYWITDSGQVMMADGNIGDYNHESYVIEAVQSELSNGGEDYEGWKHETALEILEEKKQELEDRKMELEDGVDTKSIDEKLYEIWEMSRNIDYHAYELIDSHLKELGIDQEKFDIAEGHGDARAYAMKKWGWKRLEGNNVETWTLTKNDLKTIGNGLYDAYDEEVEIASFNIYVYGNKKWYNNIPWSVIENGDMGSMREYDSLHSISTKMAQVDPAKYYTSIGHNDKDNIYMWFIDGNFNIYIRKVKPKQGHFEHEYWDKFEKYYKKNNVLAQGRYDKNENITSLVIVNFMDFTDVNYVRRMVEFVLKQEFRNLTIREFGH